MSAVGAQPRRRIEHPYRARFEESTPAGTLRTALILAYAQDCAWRHSASLGYDRDWYAERGITWLVRAARIDVLRPIATYADLVVSTEVLGFRRAMSRRSSEIRTADGTPLARADIDWLLVNERGVPTRVPLRFDEVFAGAEARSDFEVHRVPLPETPPGAARRRFEVRRRDLDPMDHVNNSVYVDYLEDALEAAGQGELLDATPRRYVLEYAGAAERAETLTDAAWRVGSKWAYRLTREDGTDLVRATFVAGQGSCGPEEGE